ncbi:MAG: hypothetical protein HQL32_05750, partial [Planctomycetes bacterium]|nr:hypothetical protein [Planctomycetota bacterium]
TTGTQEIYNEQIISDDSANETFVTGDFVTVLDGDSLDYLLSQLDNLKGFNAALNDSNTGIDLQRTNLYSTAITPGADTATDLTITPSTGIAFSPLTFTGATVSEMAADINTYAESISSISLHAEVSDDGNTLLVSSNDQISLDFTSTDDTVFDRASSEMTDLTDTALISSTFLNSLGLGGTADTNGKVEGQVILGRQVKLSDLNEGEGIDDGSLRFKLGSDMYEVDLSSAATLRDVKILIEEGTGERLTVDLNGNGNGLAISIADSTNTVTIEEVNGAAVGRHLGLIKAPANSVTGSMIVGNDLDPKLHGQILLKNLNNGQGIDSTGFVITNGDRTIDITMDSDDDGVNDIRTLQELVNHINMKSAQGDIYVEADIDVDSGKLEIVSKLANTTLRVDELQVDYPVYETTGLTGLTTDDITIQNADASTSITVAGLAGNVADTIAKINAEAVKTTTDFAFRAQLAEDGTVEIISDATISVYDTNTAYTTAQMVPNPPVEGTTASDLGLRGAFSESTLLSSLNGGTGIEHGQFILKYGTAATSTYSVSGFDFSDADTIDFYNENGSRTASFDLSTVATNNTDLMNAINADANVAALGITAAIDSDDGSVVVSSSNKFSIDNTTTPETSYVLEYNNFDTLSSSATEYVIDLEFGTTLGDVKTAIEQATENEVLVSFGSSNRLEFTLANGDITQMIEFEENSGSSDVAHTLGLMSDDLIRGSELRSGSIDILTSATKLSDLGLDMETPASAFSTENDLVILTSQGAVTIDLTSTRTVGDVLSVVNQVTETDAGNSVSFEARIINGRYLEIESVQGLPISILSSDFSKPAEKLGLVADPSMVDNTTFRGTDLDPTHEALNFFSALTTIRDEFQAGASNKSKISNALLALQEMQSQFLVARGETGSRIGRFDTLKTRFEEEELNIENLLGQKTEIDIIEVTQRFMAQQQIYQSGLSSVSRILGTSLFNFI